MHEQSGYSHMCVARACLLFTSSLRNIVFLLFTVALAWAWKKSFGNFHVNPLNAAIALARALYSNLWT